MASVKNIVKVMNFHSLIRVDKARKVAEEYFDVEQELTKMMYKVIYNKNLVLDKKILVSNNKGTVIDIYIGNDLGFCGNFNHQLLQAIEEDNDNEKIIVGKKIFPKNDKNVLLKITKEDFFQNYQKIENIIYEYVMEHKLKEINVIYNHYYNVNDIRFERKTLFPVELEKDIVKDINLDVDYVIEADIKEVITSILALYLCYQIKILESNSWASENVMREKVTRDSIDKIEELENETHQKEVKEKKYKEFKSQISNYKNYMKE